METKEIKITVPEGYCIDEANSTFECIKLKKKEPTYVKVAKELFKDRYYCIDINGTIMVVNQGSIVPTDANTATSERQLEKLLAINKLMNIAKYLNGNWKPNWENSNQEKCFLYIGDTNNISIRITVSENSRTVYFKNTELAQQAIDILGEETIRLALSTDW